MSQDKRPSWSYSALSAFETCPRRYQLTRVTKEVVEPPSEAMTWGNRVHQMLEDYAKNQTPIPGELQKYQRYVDKILDRDGKHIIEEKLAINDRFNPTGWMSKDTWCRGIVDIGVIGETKGYLLDWKTGKRKPDMTQLQLFAALAFAHYPWIDEVVTGFIWLKDGKMDKNRFWRADLPDIWNGFLPGVKRLELAFESDKWPAKPSGLCKNWCPVGKSRCEFCGV